MLGRMQVNGQFSLKQFYRKLRIPRDERPLVEEMMAKGLEKYYYDLYGYHKYGKEPDFMIRGRLGDLKLTLLSAWPG